MKEARAIGRILISSSEIQKRVAELGQEISRDYQGRTVTLIPILKGSFVFLADLIRNLDPSMDVEMDFMSVSSYGDSTSSSGTVHIEKDLEIPVAGKDIIIVEDIVDTGLTLNNVYNIISGRGARSIKVATLLEKPGNLKHPVPVRYVGFKIPNQFVVGYGLDYAQRYRNLPEIRILDEI